MHSIFKTLMAAMIVASLSFIACNKDDDDDPQPCIWAQELQAEANAVVAAAAVYSNDMSQANCLAYKAAVQAYLNEADDYLDCAELAGERAALEQAIIDAQADLDAFQC